MRTEQVPVTTLGSSRNTRLLLNRRRVNPRAKCTRLNQAFGSQIPGDRLGPLPYRAHRTEAPRPMQNNNPEPESGILDTSPLSDGLPAENELAASASPIRSGIDATNARSDRPTQEIRPWLVREIGGAPCWLLIVTALTALVVPVFAYVTSST